MRRAQKDYEDKAMSTKPPPREPTKPAPSGPPVDVRPSEAELAEAREEAAESGATGTPRPSEADLAEAREERVKEQQEAAEQTKEPPQP